MSLTGPGRKIALAVLAFVLAVAVVAVSTVVLTLRRPLPDWSGSVQVPGISADVTVKRDAQGVPQVYANTSTDLFFGQGYVQAQDRFFQMDLRRHITAGRVSELLGEAEGALQADQVMRTLGLRQVAEKELALLKPETRRYLQAYADGVNAYISQRGQSTLAAEYTVLGIRSDLPAIEEWTPVDSLTWLKAIAWDLKSNYNDELGRGLTYAGLNGQVALVNELYPHYPYGTNKPIISTGTSTSGAAVGPVQRVTMGAPASAGTARPGTGQPGTPAKAGEARRAADASSRLREALDKDAVTTAIAAAYDAIGAMPHVLGKGAGVGSNSWVVSGRHTESGKPILANDPHLGAELPSVWSQVGLHCREVNQGCPFDVAGFSFAGMPGVVIGHNQSVAWGFTNMGADVTDFFLEQVSGDSVLREGKWEPLTIREETIEVAGGEPVTMRVRSSKHGPLMSDALSAVSSLGTRPRTSATPASTTQSGGAGSEYSVALQWTALTPGRTMDALFAINTSQNFTQFRQAAAAFEVPAQNMVYADVAGNIGYQAPGRIPVRRPGTVQGMGDGTWPRLGWDAAWDWAGYVPSSEMPWSYNPPSGILVAANQAVTAPGQGPFLSRDFDHGYRSQRILDQLIAATANAGKVSVNSTAELQLDTYNSFADILVPALLQAPLVTSSASGRGPEVNETYMREAIRLLGGWDRRSDPDSAAAAYYNAVWSNLLRLTFADQLPQQVDIDGDARWFTVVANLLQKPNSPLWDDARTPGLVESRDQILGEALYAARIELTASLGKDPKKWSWGKLHRLELRSQVLGSGEGVPGPVAWLFSTDDHAVAGGTSLVNDTSWNATIVGDYEITSVPSMRMVVDLSDLNGSRWVDLSGVSGHAGSPHYDDQFDAWLNGRTYPWPFTAEAVDSATDNTLTLTPGGE